MGTTRWSDDHYRARAAFRLATGTSAFDYDDDIRAQRVAARVNPLMDPANLKGGVRESRDSDAHPQSNAVAVLFDVTGSMQAVPRMLQRNLCALFNLLVRQQYLSDPAILIGGIGDATCDRASLQVGQFESGNEIEDDLSRLFLEGGGGGQKSESYELALYFLARKTALDCHSRRGKKGYAFLIGDELPYPRVKRREVEHVFGDQLKSDIPIRQIVAEAQQMYEIYYILPNLTSHYDDPEILDCWRGLLGQNVLRLDDPAGISELIASTIGLSENAVDWNDLSDDLHDAGASRDVAGAIASALSPTRSRDLRDTGLTHF
jgi:hypothetical protein